MKKNSFRVIATAGLLGCSVFLSMQTASASVIGSLQLNGGAVTVGAASLTWQGFATVNPFSNLTYGSGTPLPSGNTSTVTIMNLPPIALPDINFMTFTLVPTLHFDLMSIGPGSANTNCAFAPCSVFAGSPIVLTQGSQGTVVDLGVAGSANDGTIPVSAWHGEFSATVTTLPGFSPGTIITPAEVQNFFLTTQGASITDTYSGTFTVILTPEPSSLAMALMGSTLILFSAYRRRTKLR